MIDCVRVYTHRDRRHVAGGWKPPALKRSVGSGRFRVHAKNRPRRA